MTRPLLLAAALILILAAPARSAAPAPSGPLAPNGTPAPASPLPAAGTPAPTATPEGSFAYEILPGQDIVHLDGARYECIIPRAYHEAVTSGAGQEARTALDLALSYKGVDTTRDYILYDEVSGNQISKFTILDTSKAHVTDGVILFDKPTDSVRLRIPLDHETARAGKLTLSLRGVNRQETYDLEKKVSYAILKPTIELKPPFAKYRATVSALPGRYSLTLTVEDFNQGYLLSTLDKRDEAQDVSRRDASFDLPFSAPKDGVRQAGFCLWPRFAQTYPPELLAKDILCETFTSAVNQEADLAAVQKALPEIARKLPPESKDKARPGPSAQPGTPEGSRTQKTLAERPAFPEKAPADKGASARPAERKEVPGEGVRLRLRSDSDPGDSVRVNGQDIGPTPATYTFAKGKTYTLELRYSRDSGGGQKTYAVEVGSDKFTVRYKDTAETEALAPGGSFDLWLHVKKDRPKDFRLVRLQ